MDKTIRQLLLPDFLTGLKTYGVAIIVVIACNFIFFYGDSKFTSYYLAIGLAVLMLFYMNRLSFSLAQKQHLYLSLPISRKKFLQSMFGILLIGAFAVNIIFFIAFLFSNAVSGATNLVIGAYSCAVCISFLVIFAGIYYHYQFGSQISDFLLLITIVVMGIIGYILYLLLPVAWMLIFMVILTIAGMYAFYTLSLKAYERFEFSALTI